MTLQCGTFGQAFAIVVAAPWPRQPTARALRAALSSSDRADRAPTDALEWVGVCDGLGEGTRMGPSPRPGREHWEQQVEDAVNRVAVPVGGERSDDPATEDVWSRPAEALPISWSA